MPVISPLLSLVSTIAALWISTNLLASFVSTQAGNLPGWRARIVGIIVGDERGLYTIS